MNFYKFLRLNLFFFQLCGFYPDRIALAIHPTIDKIAITIVTIFHLASVTLQASIAFYHNDLLFNRAIRLGKVVDMSKYAYLAVTCLTILIESILTVDDQASFWSLSRNVQKNFQGILPASTRITQNRIYKKNILKTYAITAVFVCVQIYLAVQRTCLFCTIYTFLAFYAFNRFLQYILYVDVIHQQTVNLGCELERIIEISVCMSRKKFSDDYKRDVEVFLVRKLKVASRLYVKLYDMSVKVNSAFGWSLIINLVHSYIQIFVDFFWMFQLVSNGFGEYFVECLISMLPSLMIVGLVFYTTMDCHRKVHNVKMKLHGIKESEHATQLSTLIRNFTLQTQHLAIILEAKGFFSMEFDQLKDMVGSIATFMVFIVQSTVTAQINFYLVRYENGHRVM